MLFLVRFLCSVRGACWAVLQLLWEALVRIKGLKKKMLPDRIKHNVCTCWAMGNVSLD